jgi:hypothetical protein
MSNNSEAIKSVKIEKKDCATVSQKKMNSPFANSFFEVSFLSPLTLQRQTCHEVYSELPPLLHPLLQRQFGYIATTDKHDSDFVLETRATDPIHTCSSCHVQKPASLFYKAKDKLRTACKECTKESERKRYKERKSNL